MTAGRAEFLSRLQTALDEGGLRSLVFARRRGNSADLPRKQTVRPVEIRSRMLFQWELQFERQQTHLNLTASETVTRADSLLEQHYREAYLFTASEEISLKERKGRLVFSTRAAAAPLPIVTDHNRSKLYLIPEGTPCPFLEQLDVMTASGKVKQSRRKKFRQINRYLEIVSDVTSHLPGTGTLRVVDLGCGLSYLTFAVHHLLTKIQGRQVHLVGVDRNEQVISRCRAIAETLHLQGIEFSTDPISQFQPGEVDLAISLHACDTATDDALAWAVAAGAGVILAAPCCQHELAEQIQSEALQELLRQGILKERLAALATDGLRVAALEAAGYRTQILEFIDLEHTPKNLLIRAVKRRDQRESADAVARYDQLKSALGVATLAVDRILSARG